MFDSTGIKMDSLAEKFKGTFFFEEERVDLSKLTISDSATRIEVDEENLTFTVTCDRVCYSSLFSIVSKVLTSHHYQINLENILATFDSIRFGVNVTAKEGKDAFLPALQFNFPTKKKQQGNVLKLFYQEISVYEEALSQAKAKNLEGKSIDEIKRENLGLKSTLKRTEEENRSLKNQLSNWKSQFRRASNDLNKGETLPSNVRSAIVKSVDLDQRSVNVSTGRKLFTYPIQKLTGLPSPGSPCLIQVEQGTIENLFLLTKELEEFSIKIGKVLNIKDDLMKLRTSDRDILLVEAANNSEESSMTKIKRGSRVVLYFIGSRLMRFDSIVETADDKIIFEVQEQLLKKHLILQQEQQAKKGNK